MVSGPNVIELGPFRNFRFHLPTEPMVRGRFGSLAPALLPDDLAFLLPVHDRRRGELLNILLRAGSIMGIDALMTPSIYTTAPRKSSREKLCQICALDLVEQFDARRGDADDTGAGTSD